VAEPRSWGWGWHALDRRWAELLVADSWIAPGTLVVDIGAGTGALTGLLLDAGARVIAVEAHPGRAAALHRRFGNSIVIVQADARDLRLPRHSYRVVANPPFAVTSPLLRRLLQPGTRLAGADLVLQDRAARRWASPAAPGYARWGTHLTASLGRPLPKTAFRPPPDVKARVLRIRSRP
jgi:23S rRNA (adenine-N6)-dimethyltransferase